MIAFRLGCEETANPHGDRSRDELCHTSQNDELRLSQTRQAGCKCEWHSETIGEADDNISNYVGIYELSLVISFQLFATYTLAAILMSGTFRGQWRLFSCH